MDNASLIVNSVKGFFQCRKDEKELNDIKSLKNLGIICCKETNKQADPIYSFKKCNFEKH